MMAAATGAAALLYVSCNPATLARDLAILTTEQWEIQNLILLDLFPQTFHIETIAYLVRSDER